MSYDPGNPIEVANRQVQLLEDIKLLLQKIVVHLEKVTEEKVYDHDVHP